MKSHSPIEKAPKLKERMRQATRAAILDAAEHVYVRHGFEAGRMEQIAESAGVSVGTLYNYFADRKSLVGSLLEDRRAELLRRVDEALASAPDRPVERLRALARSALDHVEAHRPFVSLLVQEGAGDCGPSPLAKAPGPTTTILGLQTRVRATLERARKQGRLADKNVVLLSHLFTGSLRAVIFFGLAEREPIDPKATADRIVHYFLEGVEIA
jgi:AcrR family transcriptional regulator